MIWQKAIGVIAKLYQAIWKLYPIWSRSYRFLPHFYTPIRSLSKNTKNTYSCYSSIASGTAARKPTYSSPIASNDLTLFLIANTKYPLLGGVSHA